MYQYYTIYCDTYDMKFERSCHSQTQSTFLDFRINSIEMGFEEISSYKKDTYLGNLKVSFYINAF